MWKISSSIYLVTEYMDEDIIYKKICIENSDFVCVINPEIKADTDELYLVFKMLKRRYRSVEEDEKMNYEDLFSDESEGE